MTNKNISKVYLLSVPLENDYKNTLYFTNKDNQHSYFASKIVKSYDNFSYQRKDHVIRIPEEYDKIYNCNYVMYQNTAYSNKWFYCFIKEMKFISEGVTEVIIETDVMQTWAFDYTIKPSFVEREHVIDDSIGLHTVPEQLETGEYICNEKIDDTKLKDLAVYIAFSDYANSDINVVGNKYGGIYSGMGYRIFPISKDADVLAINEFLNSYDSDAKADAINSLFMCPAFLGISNDESTSNFSAHQVNSSGAPKHYSIDIDFQTTLNGYTPRNKKLLTGDYNYLLVSNNNGGGAIYKYEYWENGYCNFNVSGCLTPGGSIRIIPFDYKGVSINNEEGLNAGKFPICCWNTDTYTNWLTQNGVNIGLSLLSGVGQIAFGGGFGVASGLGTIAGTLAQVHQQSMVPDQVKGNTNCGDVITGDGDNTFMFYKMSIKKEWAERLDKYFDMFGYKVNMVKTPNKAHRSRYWYTKTIDINIDGSIPMDDMQKIKDCYNRGITFWRNASEIQNYDLTNEIV